MFFEILVLAGEADNFGISFFPGRDAVQVIGCAEAVAGGNDAVAAQGKAAIVIVAVGQLPHFALQVGGIRHAAGMPHAGEIEGAAVLRPAEAVHAGLETFRHVSLFPAFQVQHAKAGAVALSQATYCPSGE